MGYGIFISKTLVYCWNLVFTKSPFLGKKYFGSRKKWETWWRSGKFHWLALIQLALSSRERSRPMLGLLEQQSGQGGFALVLVHIFWFMTWEKILLFWAQRCVGACAGPLAGPDLLFQALPARLQCREVVQPACNSLCSAGELSDGLHHRQHGKDLNEVRMNGKSHFDGIALGY